MSVQSLYPLIAHVQVVPKTDPTMLFETSPSGVARVSGKLPLDDREAKAAAPAYILRRSGRRAYRGPSGNRVEKICGRSRSRASLRFDWFLPDGPHDKPPYRLRLAQYIAAGAERQPDPRSNNSRFWPIQHLSISCKAGHHQEEQGRARIMASSTTLGDVSDSSGAHFPPRSGPSAANDGI